MKLFALSLILSATACQTLSNPRITATNQGIDALERYTGDLPWSQIEAKLPEMKKTATCAYHVVDVEVDQEGKVTTAKVINSSLAEYEEITLEAANNWRFKVPSSDIRKGRIAFVYNKWDSPIAYLIPLNHSDSKNYQPYEKDSKRKVVRRTLPRAPKGAMMKGIEGSVIVEHDILPDGSVDNIETVFSYPPQVFDKAAQKAIAEWRYEEGETGYRSRVLLDFKVDGSKKARCIF